MSNLDHLPSDPQAALLGSEQLSPSPLSNDTYVDNQVKPDKSAVDRSLCTTFWNGIPHLVPLGVTIAIILLNARKFYFQDLGLSRQNAELQAFQYGAKAHEMMMTTSLTAIVLYQFRSDLYGSKGVPLGFLTAGFQLNTPSSVPTKKFWGGATARAHSSKWWRLSRLTYLLVLGFALTSVVGPSSAIAMIPRLDWWDMSQVQAFGREYNDRVYFNHTEAELWPGDITNAIYADVNWCSAANISKQDCAVRAIDIVGPWISRHQSEGTKPNITVFQDSEVSRYLTSQGGPPDNSSRTVSSTIPSILAKDLNHYWDWQVENGSLPTSVSRPLLRPAFINLTFKMKKPLVQVQCQSYLNPDWERETFEFPHDELVTPPLDAFRDDTWGLPNEFVLNLKGNESSTYDRKHSRFLFDWFDAASNFSGQGVPSLGAVAIYFAWNGTAFVPVLTTCSVDGRWTPVQYYLDPKDTITIRQDSPNPIDILNGSSKEAANGLTRMRMSLDWANTMNVQSNDPQVPSMTVVEEMLEGFSGGGNFIFPEPEKTASGYVMKSLDWRISTTLGLYLTEGLARAFSDLGKGSMLYRQATKIEQSYVRYLNDVNQPALKYGYRNGKLDWMETRDPCWNDSILPWDEWAPQNGYTEIKITVQRNGYGYGFEGVPIKLAATVLGIYSALVCVHLITLGVERRIYKGCSDMGDMVALAWGSAPTVEMKNLSAGIRHHQTARRMAKVREKEGRLQLV